MQNSELKMIKFLSKYIADNSMNQTEFAKMIGMEQKTVNNYLNGKRTPSVEFVEKTIRTFGFKPSDLLAIDDEIIDDGNNISLYHYTSAEGLICILNSGRLRFSSFLNANDVKEREMYRHYKDIKEKAKSQLDSEYKYISFCKYSSSEVYRRINDDDIIFRPNNRVMLSRMWGHYGTTRFTKGDVKESRMTGACIELDFEKVKKKVQQTQDLDIFEIKYDERPEAFAYYSRSKEENWGPEIDAKFKYNDWKSEKEYRILSKKSVLKEFDITDCIKLIHLGVDFRYENLEEICKILSSKRYNTITPKTFTKLIINKGGLIQNMGINVTGIAEQMLLYIKKNDPDYYSHLDIDESIEKYIDNNPINVFSKIKEEAEEDIEVNKLNVDYYKNKYYNSIKEKNELLREISRLKDDIIEFQKEKNVFVDQVTDVSVVKPKTGTSL